MKKVPNLRFKEFSGEWESKPLGELDVVLTRGPFGSALKKEIMVPKEDNTYKVYEQKHAIQKDSTIGEYYISELKYKELIRFSVSPGDFIMSCSGTIGEIFKIPQNAEKGVINQALLKFSVGKSINEDFFLYSFRKNLQSLETKGSGIKNITSVKFLKDEFIISFPKIEEQEKIASFFSFIDKKIELQTEKVEELKNYKKGLMQKIFSQELRFKDENGNEYPEWEEVNLRKILKEVSEKTTVINQYEVISSTNNGLYLQKDYFNREIASKDNIGYKILKRNQVVLSPQNLWMGNINLNSKYDIGMVSPSYKIFDIKSEFDSSYIGFILRTDRAFYEYKQASEQGASIVRRNLNMDLFYDVSFNLPCKAEQFKISKFINKIDCKIEQEVEKLESLNEYQKGLLQQMFI